MNTLLMYVATFLEWVKSVPIPFIPTATLWDVLRILGIMLAVILGEFLLKKIKANVTTLLYILKKPETLPIFLISIAQKVGIHTGIQIIVIIQLLLAYAAIHYGLLPYHWPSKTLTLSILQHTIGNLYILWLLIQSIKGLSSWQKQGHTLIKGMSLSWIKTGNMRRFFRHISVVGASFLTFSITLCLLALYVNFLEQNYMGSAQLYISHRFIGLLLIAGTYYLYKLLKPIFRETKSILATQLKKITFDITVQRITLIRKDQAIYFISSLFLGLIRLVITYGTYLLITVGISHSFFILKPSTLQPFNDILHAGILLYLISVFLIWFHTSMAQLKPKYALLSRILKLNLRITKTSSFNKLQFEPFIKSVISIFSLFITGITAYLGTTAILQLLPMTKNLSAILIQYVLMPVQSGAVGLFNFIPNLIIITLILVVSNYLMNFVKFIFKEIEIGHITFQSFHPDFAIPTYKIVRFLIIVFTVILVFPYLPGSQSPAFKGVSVFLGVLFSLGSSSVVANMMAGIMITYMRPFKIGDRVKIADSIGDVVEKTLLVTRIKTIKNIYIAIPNAAVLGSHIINYSFMNTEVPIILNTKITIGYDVDWKTVHRLLQSAADATPGILKDPAPFVLQTALSDFYVEYEINAYTTQVHAMSKLYSALHENIQTEFRRGGVEITSPHYEIQRHESFQDTPTLPSKKEKKA